jgi:hypothetical protein
MIAAKEVTDAGEPILASVEEVPATCIECGQQFKGEGRLCARCYVEVKT